MLEQSGQSAGSIPLGMPAIPVQALLLDGCLLRRIRTLGSAGWWYAGTMTTDTDIELSGAFQAKDSNGRTLDVKAIRIFDEGYGIIDVYVEFAAKLEPGAYKDSVLVRQIIERLRAVGYKGPDFSHSDPGLQESRLIVLEAPEEFAPFAKSRGWKNLAEEFDE